MVQTMERKFQCPSCGAGNVVTNPGILMKICDFCKTAIYWDKESALRAGRKSMDLPGSSRFRVGATGKLGDETFRILGRLSYAHEKGTWNEWFIEMHDRSIRWLAEDEGELFLEQSVNLTSPVPSYKELEPGMQVVLADEVGVIEEIGEARCLGGEGEIPFEVEIGETYPYADGTAADGSFIFGLEYDTESGIPRAFRGKALSLAESQAEPRADQDAVARTAEVIRCASCGKPYEGRRVETTEMVVCDSCGAALQLDEAETRVVGRNPGRKPHFTFEVGTRITLEKITYEVMGRLYYVEVEEGIQYPSYEYALYHPEKGYLWLSEETGHFTVSQPLHLRVYIESFWPKSKVRVGREQFSVFEDGFVTLRWVDGALPWTAVVGEETNYVHMIKPPEYVDREITGKEMELFRGRYVSRSEMLSAIPPGVTLPPARGVYSCQPYVASDWVRGLGKIGALFLVLNLVLWIYSFVSERTSVVLREKISANQYTKEHMSKPFEVSRDGSILRLVGKVPLNNSWLGLDFGLVDSQDQVIKEFSNEASYYHGRDSEGYWSEGSRSFSSYFKVERAGTYRLLMHATGGSGYRRGPPKNEPVQLTVKTGATISSYFIFPIILSALFALIGVISRGIFETRRWAPVMEDDDD